MKTKIFSVLVSVFLAGCVVAPRVRPANRVELYRLKQQADAMQSAVSNIVFQPTKKASP